MKSNFEDEGTHRLLNEFEEVVGRLGRCRVVNESAEVEINGSTILLPVSALDIINAVRLQPHEFVGILVLDDRIRVRRVVDAPRPGVEDEILLSGPIATRKLTERTRTITDVRRTFGRIQQRPKP